MVTSVALATVAPSYWNTGGYPIFLLLLLPITLSCSQLHPFQRCDDFALTMSVMRATIATMVPSSAPAQATAPYPIFFQTHPMPHVAPPLVAVSPVTMVPRRMERRQWDPGILPVARPTPTPQTRPPTKSAQRSCRSAPIPVHMATMASLPILVHMATRVSLLMSTLLIRSTACCVNTTSPPFVCYLNRSSSCCCLAMPWLNINNTVSLVEFHPDIAPSASVFHYCHPVLSRPTVPNIDS